LTQNPWTVGATYCFHLYNVTALKIQDVLARTYYTNPTSNVSIYMLQLARTRKNKKEMQFYCIVADVHSVLPPSVSCAECNA
jgi:hypothetical protein